MKSPQHTTPEQAGPTLGEISRWHERLRALHARLRPHFARPEVHQQDEAPFPVLVLDESGFPKRGRHSAGVGPQ